MLLAQEMLYMLGYLDVAPTGYYGPKTEQAVLQFQLKNKIILSAKEKGAGVVGPKTKEKLINMYKSFTEKMITVELDIGAQGKEVSKVQTILKQQGYFKDAVTGFFGPKTQQALIAFQKKEQIIENEKSLGAGRVGVTTMKILNRYITL